MDGADWKSRLFAAIEADTRSDRSLSLDAGLGENYVQQMKTRGKNIGAAQVLKLCEALNLSSTYIFTGATMTPDEEEVVRLFSSLPANQKDYFLGFLRALRSDDAAE